MNVLLSIGTPVLVVIIAIIAVIILFKTCYKTALPNTAMVKEVMGSISPDLIAAMQATSNAEMLETLTKNMSPYAIAKGESIVDTTTQLLRGTPMEEFVGNLDRVLNK